VAVQLDPALLADISRAIANAIAPLAPAGDLRDPANLKFGGHVTVALLRAAVMTAIALGNSPEAWNATAADAYQIAMREIARKLARKGTN
jgi:hypothetical protein